jgi:K(+)-stimulated pyrophosphate-energized sodium pump
LVLHCIGENVNHVMGVSSEMTDSMLMALLASLIIGMSLYGEDGIALPFWLLAAGIISSIIGMLVVSIGMWKFGEGAPGI